MWLLRVSSEDRMHGAVLQAQGCASDTSFLAQYPLTCHDPEYFEHERSVKEQADKLARVAADLDNLYYRKVRAQRRVNRAHRAISHASRPRSGAESADTPLPRILPGDLLTHPR